ncbi:MAG: TonB family protein [Longimicrobiaceae bacterium]
MLAHVRAPLAAALVLLVAGSAPAAAQQRECSAADRARVAWSPPPGVADEAWRAMLLTLGLVAPGTEMVRIASDSMPGAGDAEHKLFWELDRVIRERLGDGPVKVVVLMRIEADSTLSRLLLAQASGGMVGIEESIDQATRRMHFRPLFRDGCPMTTLSPLIVQIFPAQRIGRAAARDEGTYSLEPPPPSRPRPPEGDRWVRVSPSEWIDTTSVSRVRENVYRFTLRQAYDQLLRRESDGLMLDGSEDSLEFNCARGRSRTLGRKWLLGERVVEVAEIHVSVQRFWNLSNPRLRDAYCPVLTQAPPRPPPTPGAGQRDTANPSVPITMAFVADWREATPRLMGLFPPAAREAGVTSGSASLKFRVMTDSTVDPASITVEGQSRPEFAQPAKEFVARTRFVPAKVGGRPVAAWIRHTVYFQDSRVESSFSGIGRAGAFEPPVLLNAEELPGLVETHYPAALRDAGVAGSVLVSFDVSPTGAVELDRIEVQLTTDPAFEEPALAIVRTLRFRPARLGGGAVKGRATMPLHFGQVHAGSW